MKSKEIIVEKSESLVNVLADNFSELSKKKIKSYVKYKMVYVDGVVVTNSSFMVSKGCKIRVY